MAQDMTALNQADPSLMNNFRLIYEKKVPVKMSLIDPETETRLAKSLQSATIEETMNCKVLVQGHAGAVSAEEDPQVIRIEFTSPNDLFFHYTHEVDNNEFLRMKDRQGFKGEFPQYITMLIELFNSMCTDSEVYYLHLKLNKDNTSDLEFMKKLPFKEVLILKADFFNENEVRVKKHVRHWYHLSKLTCEQA